MNTLTREDAHALVDSAFLGEGYYTLQELAADWDVPGHWNATITNDEWYDTLHEFVDDAASGDDQRSTGPKDSDDTGLSEPGA